MTRQLATQSTHLVTTTHGCYIVILQGIKNDANGNRRYKAYVVDQMHLATERKAAAHVYTFTGGYRGEEDAAESIVYHHINYGK